MYYTAKVKITTFDERSGRPKSHSESYLLTDAVSPTDVEVQITKEFEGVSFDWEITNISTSNIVKVLTGENTSEFNV